MKIEVYALAHNEEKLMPYFMKHYGQFAHVVILENNSTDRTVEIAKSMGAEVWEYDVPDEINDQWFIDIKNNSWKNSKADWIMVVDTDEFIYHPDIKTFLSETLYTAFLPSFYNMYSYVFPTTDGQIYDEVKYGVRWGGEMNIYGKINLIKRPEIEEINYLPGCHKANLKGIVKLCVTNEIKTLHMRNLSVEFVVDRTVRHARRLSELNKKMGWGSHFTKSPIEIEHEMLGVMQNLEKVV